MEIFSGIILYLCYWWLAFMLALPFGVSVASKQEAPGFAESAPISPKIGRKFIIATVMSLIMWLVTFIIISYEMVKLPEL